MKWHVLITVCYDAQNHIIFETQPEVEKYINEFNPAKVSGNWIDHVFYGQEYDVEEFEKVTSYRLVEHP